MIIITGAFAQLEDGKSYYDADKTKPKELYCYKPGSSNKIKQGPYYFYYESGKLKISGQYKDDQKHGDWKYYESGKNIKTEHYENGQLK
jgi:antitoxin component YwqK of YwqJK toxin-antitoxin module